MGERANPRLDASSDVVICWLCTATLGSAVKSGRTVQDEYKMVESLCCFMGINLPKKYCWNIGVETFPFCDDCIPCLEELTNLYNELDSLQAKVVRVVDRVKKSVTSSNRTKSSAVTGNNIQLNYFRELLTKKMTKTEDVTSKDCGSESTKHRCKKPSKIVGRKKQAKRAASTHGSPTVELVELQMVDVEADLGSPCNVSFTTSTTGVDKTPRTDQRHNPEPLCELIKTTNRNKEPLCEEDVSAELRFVSDTTSVPHTSRNGESESEKSTELKIEGSEVLRTSATLQPMMDGKINHGTEESYFVDKGVDWKKKMVQCAKPPWDAFFTFHGFTYAGISVPSVEGGFHCSICNSKFRNCEKAIDHLEFVHLGYDHWYPCSYCHQIFRCTLDVQSHNSSRHPGKPIEKWNLVCKSCRKRFCSPEMLNQHQQIHSIIPNHSSKDSQRIKTTGSRKRSKSVPQPSRSSLPRQAKLNGLGVPTAYI